jgi:hypothetical protein
MRGVHRSVTTSGLIAGDHSLTVRVTTDLPPGPVTVTLTFEAEADEYMAAGMLEDLGILGAWEHRQDIGDSVEFAKGLREKAWR